MVKSFLFSLSLAICVCGFGQKEANQSSIFNAIADTSFFIVPEISTHQLKKLIVEGSILLLDTRPHEEWASGHLPGAINVAPKPGMPMSLYTSDVEEILRLVKEEKSKALVLYCNGPFCDKSKRLSEDLVKTGFTNVVRYQLGTPFWRATGNVMEIEKDGLLYFHNDPTAVWIDARDSTEFNKSTIQNAVNIPFKSLTGKKNTGVIKKVKDNGRLPMHDHNTRIVVFGNNKEEAAAVAGALTKEAFHNVNYFIGSFVEAKQVIDSFRKRKKITR